MRMASLALPILLAAPATAQLAPPDAPAGDPVTAAKVKLGKALWSRCCRRRRWAMTVEPGPT